MELKTLVDKAVQGDERALARCMSVIETGGDSLRELTHLIPPSKKSSLKIGLTGSPGCGKSTLVSQILDLLSPQKKGIGVIAVDPSSPLTGGAILGDRVRLNSRTSSDGIFFRSLATHGATGGLSVPVYHMMTLLEAVGKEIIIFETTGVGQQEFDVAFLADVVVLVLTPHSGDDMQLLKAGVLETADLLVVNKGDMEGAERFMAHIQNYLQGCDSAPVLVQTVASRGEGIKNLWDQIVGYRKKNIDLIKARKMGLRNHMVLKLVQERIRDYIFHDESLRGILETSESMSPFDLAGMIGEKILGDKE